MIRKISQVGSQIKFSELFSSYKGLFIDYEKDFINALSDYLPSKNTYLVNSGTASFYVILQALKKFSAKKEVILPSYTAPALVLPVLKAGLKPVLCDISLSDFNIDLNLLHKVITENTLCVVPVHMFGIVVSGIERLKERVKGVYIVEDCAQSMGSKIGMKNTGTFSDVGFLSFNRGKNLGTYGGGCIFTNSDELSKEIKIEVDRLKEKKAFFKFILPFKIAGFSLAAKPYVFGPFYHIISKFKDNEVPVSFSLEKYTNLQAFLGLNLLKRIDEFSIRRYKNGVSVINGLKDTKGIIAPRIHGDTMPAFNRLPIVIEDLSLREKVENALLNAGIDTSRMYLKPIHHIFGLGYKKEDFPNANYFSQGLLTLPVHPLVTDKDLEKVINTVREVLK